MNLQIRWLANLSTTCINAASAICQGKSICDQALADALAKPCDALLRDIKAASIQQPLLWKHLLPLSTGIENNHQLAERTLQRLSGPHHSEHLTSLLAGHIAALEAAARRAFPDLVEELRLRTRPLKEQWEARGPGMMGRLRESTEELAIINAADVSIVRPIFGGGGSAHLDHGVVVFEAVLFHPHQTLPETVRLAWLLSQLKMNAPIFSERVPSDRLDRIAALAMLPPTLDAAESVDLARHDKATVRTALTTWRLADADQANELTETLDIWWTTYRQAPTSWATALSALDRLME